jgi:hypothetical protein
MLKRLLLMILMTTPAQWALAADFTDIWWNPAESGWGVTLVENDPFIFATFFIYGSDGKPTWYTGQMNGDSNGNFTGLLYATTGPYFGAATYDPTLVSTTAVGNVSFQASAADQGTITYNVGAVRVTKHIQRQTLTHTFIGGHYRGGLSSSLGGCTDTARNGTTDNFADVDVTQSPSNQVQLNVQLQTGVSCTLQGMLLQSGKIFAPATMTYSCSNGTNSTATVYETALTGQGIEGRWIANAGGGCTEDAHFSAVIK